MPLLDCVQLNYQNLDNKRIKPITILLSEDEKVERQLDRLITRLNVPIIMMTRIRRTHAARRTKSRT